MRLPETGTQAIDNKLVIVDALPVRILYIIETAWHFIHTAWLKHDTTLFYIKIPIQICETK